MAMFPDEYAQQRLAAMLADVLEQSWSIFEAPEQRVVSIQELRRRAFDIFRLTQPISELRIYGELEPGDAALGILHNVASGYALLCNDWNTDEIAKLALPQRRVVEGVLRHEGLEKWAEELGYPLRLEVADSPNSLFYHPPTGEPSTAGLKRFVSNFSGIARAYDSLLTAHSDRRVLNDIRTPNNRAFSCQLLARANASGGWARANLEPTHLPLVAAILHMGAGCFIIAWGAGAEDDCFPSTDYLWRLTRLNDVHEWLAKQEMSLPPWLE